WSPACPKPKAISSGSQVPLPLKSTNQTPFEKTPGSCLPSPFQSPTNGTSPGEPQPKTSVAGSNRKSPLRSRNQVESGATTPRFVTPSAFQSPTIGFHPAT